MTDRNVSALALPTPPVITLASRVSVGANIRMATSSGVSSGASPFTAVNDMLAFPFVLSSPTTIYKAMWLASASGGNYSVGVYDADFRLLAQTASTVSSGGGVPQIAALSATIKLAAGLYYCAIAHDDTTTGQIYRWSVTTTGAGIWKSFGCWRQSSVTLAALPNPATPAAINNVGFPMYGLITRSGFDV